MMLDQAAVTDLDQRLGQVISQRSETFSATRSQNHCMRVFPGHRIACYEESM